MKYFLGIDGGGTVTTAAVANTDGEIIYKTQGKTINFYAVGMQDARNNLKEITEKIYADLNIQEFYSAFIGCSALDDEAHSDTLNALCDGIIKAKKVAMNSDVYVALKGATGNCVAICGTGSMVIGETADKKIVVKGGWGHILGDEGSAYSIAVEGLKVACALWDKNEQAQLVSGALSYFGEQDLRNIISKVYSPDCNKDYIAGFAKNVDDCANKGCGICRDIILKQAEAFACTFKALYDELGEISILGLYGGVLCNSVLFKEAFVNKIKSFCPHIKAEILSVPPYEGAIKAAMEL